MSYHEPSYIRKDAMVAEALRNWEEYSREQAEINRKLSGVETLLLIADPSLSSISSTLIRELRFFGKDADEWIAKPRK